MAHISDQLPLTVDEDSFVTQIYGSTNYVIPATHTTALLASISMVYCIVQYYNTYR